MTYDHKNVEGLYLIINEVDNSLFEHERWLSKTLHSSGRRGIKLCGRDMSSFLQRFWEHGLTNTLTVWKDQSELNMLKTHERNNQDLRGDLTFTSMNNILVNNHSNESYQAVLSCGIVYYAVQGGSNC